MKNYQYLIIGGAAKAGTTSLYYYLAAHPQICGSTVKESEFFLDTDFPLRSSFRFCSHEEGLANYAKIYKHCSSTAQIRMEASPFYLYSSGTPLRIKNALPHVKLVFILREPVALFISFYKYHKQTGLISSKMKFSEYVQKEFEKISSHSNTKSISILLSGCYSLYLNSYIEIFGRDDIFITFFEHLARDPRSVIGEICSFAGINSNFYVDYNFKIFNRTRSLKSPKVNRAFNRFQFKIKKQTYNKPKMHAMLRTCKSLIEMLLIHFNEKKMKEQDISPSEKAVLHNFYSTESNELAKILGHPIPW